MYQASPKQQQHLEHQKDVDLRERIGQDNDAMRRAGKPTDRNIPDGIEDSIVGNGVQEYKRLREVERRLDATMMRKRLELQEHGVRSTHRTKKLRIWISNTAENQPWQGKELDENAFDFNSGAEATYKVQIVGKLLDDEDDLKVQNTEKETNGAGSDPEASQEGKDNSSQKATETEPSQPRFSQFFKSISIELDRAKALQQDASNMIEWKKPTVAPNAQPLPTSADFDSLQFERKSDENINCTINLYRDERPERFALTKELSEVVEGDDATREQVMTAMWMYIKAQGLQRDEEKRLIQCDDVLRAVYTTMFLLNCINANTIPQMFKADTIYFPQISEAIIHHLLPLPPVKLPYTIRVDPDYQNSPTPTIYDVLVLADDPLEQKMLSIKRKDPEYVQTLSTISRLDSEIAQIVQALIHSKARHSFFTSMSKDPATFVKRWVSSQKRDMENILGDSRVPLGTEWVADEFRRGGKDGVWGSENVKETVQLLVGQPVNWARG